MTDDNVLGNAGYAIIGSGGGGTDGNYVFASLDELDDIKKQWATIKADIASDQNKLDIARSALFAPANDPMSDGQYSEVVESLASAIKHNEAMYEYAKSYIEKLESAVAQYKASDEMNATRVRSTDAE